METCAGTSSKVYHFQMRPDPLAKSPVKDHASALDKWVRVKLLYFYSDPIYLLSRAICYRL